MAKSNATRSRSIVLNENDIFLKKVLLISANQSKIKFLQLINQSLK